MPMESSIHPFSVKTYLRYIKYYKNIDFAKYTDENYDYDELNNIQIPLFMRWGNNKELIKQNAKDIFMEVAKAEAKVHGTSIDKIHFHEVGAMDSIIDIVGSCILIDLLCIDKIYATKVPLGSGFVKCAHGIIPVPAPAVVEILKDVPVKFNNVSGECTTPTGAAIIKTMCDKFIDEIEFETKQIGYGIGHKKFEVPNMLRTFIGVKKKEYSLGD